MPIDGDRNSSRKIKVVEYSRLSIESIGKCLLRLLTRQTEKEIWHVKLKEALELNQLSFLIKSPTRTYPASCEKKKVSHKTNVEGPSKRNRPSNKRTFSSRTPACHWHLSRTSHRNTIKMPAAQRCACLRRRNRQYQCYQLAKSFYTLKVTNRGITAIISRSIVDQWHMPKHFGESWFAYASIGVWSTLWKKVAGPPVNRQKGRQINFSWWPFDGNKWKLEEVWRHIVCS